MNFKKYKGKVKKKKKLGENKRTKKFISSKLVIFSFINRIIKLNQNVFSFPVFNFIISKLFTSIPLVLFLDQGTIFLLQAFRFLCFIFLDSKTTAPR